MKKRFVLMIMILGVLVLLTSGCTVDQFKSQVPGIKASIKMILANEKVENMGEIDTRQELETINFGAELISEVETQLNNASQNESIKNDLTGGLLPSESGTNEGSISVTFESEDLSNALNAINFSSGELQIDFEDSEDPDLIEITDLTVTNGEYTYTSDSGLIDLSGQSLDLGEPMVINYEIYIDDISELSDQINVIAGFINTEVSNVETNFAALSDLNDNPNAAFDTTFDDKILIEDYEKPDALEDISFGDNTELYLNFVLPAGVSMDLSSITITSYDNSSSEVSSFALSDTVDSGSTISGDANNEASIEIFNEFYNDMIENADTDTIKLSGSFDLSSTDIVTIDSDTVLGMKSIALNTPFSISVDNNIVEKMDPDNVESLSEDDVKDFKKVAEDIRLVIEGITNQLPVGVEIKLYLASLDDYAGQDVDNMNESDLESLKNELYVAENVLASLNVDQGIENGSEEVILNHEDFDQFKDNNLFAGIVITVPETDGAKEVIEEAEVAIKSAYAVLNISTDIDDFDE